MAPGHGSLEAGLRLDETLTPSAYVDYQHALHGGVSLFAHGDMAHLYQWDAMMGLRYRW